MGAFDDLEQLIKEGDQQDNDGWEDADIYDLAAFWEKTKGRINETIVDYRLKTTRNRVD